MTAASPNTDRSAHHEVVIIGGGFSGIGFAIKLRQAGFEDFLIIDDADAPGGTWHWNTYPGVAVDIPSFSYQFSFEKRKDWSRSYAPGRELKQYAEQCVAKYGLAQFFRFETTVVTADWDGRGGLWRLVTSTGDELTARHLVNASGVLTRPNTPDIRGVDDFAGHTMHTARWDHSLDLRGKRVAVIGTGASAVQIIPAIAPEVDQLTVYQRTPIWCMPKPDIALSRPMQWALGRIPGSQTVARLASQAFVEITFPVAAHYEGILHFRPAAEKAARAYVRSQVTDPETREKLTPRYGLGCKRPSFHNSYLSTFNRDNVVLETSPITHISADAVHSAEGGAREIDVLILATGFKVMDPDNMPTYTLRGVDGLDLTDWWNEHRLQAYEGISVPGFPNYFTIFGPYGYNGSSYFALIEAQTAHIIRVLEHARKERAAYVEVTQAANDRFFAEMLRRRGNQIFWQDSCANANSYYFDKNGDVPLRPTTTIESAIRSRRFKMSDYSFG
ncbi:NAD(P)/FAD-dependent oxidoreductase [Antrihabitans sp. YC3-6]|uniref:NAD(P)/FAD-dependent oxidoreductase n=1 Tax=Antrihabitans stalagmiti TaxID=2799499 RepID=A0A934NPM9_9NOCA|nr:NAD(P)/FAD-dependent oxidoreductase [Antrihabitans stalagmiti]MBJ8339118.1 NAD(P)/FAD-dependent oxidoreductase [Antrihabitans stalagmiti]